MDFGAFILTTLVALTFLASLAQSVTAYAAHHPDRRKRLTRSGKLAALLLLCLIYIYKVYYLDEGLVGAAMAGDVPRVKLLLARGASPNARWEDGKSALQFAKEAHNDELIATLKSAGAKE